MSALSQAIEARASELVRRVLAEMYQNPFWDERFGERGRKFAEQDGRYHVTYLCQALDASDPAILTRYAVWLQGVLTTRGMCSRHLEENFARLGDAIAEAMGDSAAPALSYLSLARQALAYQSGPARELQAHRQQLGDRVFEVLTAEPVQREGAPRMTPAELARCRDDVDYHLAYLIDSVALGRPEVFATYFAFITGFLERRQVPAERTREVLDALRVAVRDAPLSQQAEELLGRAFYIARHTLGREAEVAQ